MLPQAASQIPNAYRRSSSQCGIPVTGAKVRGQPTSRSSSVGVTTSLERNTQKQQATPSGSQGTRASSGTASKRQSYITPQRMTASGTRKSLMYSTGKMTASGTKVGSGNQRLSGRGSAIGAATCKDTRPLSDKSYQQVQVKKILDFLRKNKYENNALTSKHFPLSSKEFVNIFNFLYFFLQPQNFSAIPYQRFEENVIPILKSLKYPGPLSKSNFLTLGSMHSWPTVLGSLAFLCDLVIVYTEKLLPNITSIGFTNEDDEGFEIGKESKEKLAFNYYMDCFNEFNIGEDDFSSHTREYEHSMLENNKINIEELKLLKQKEVELRNMLTQAENTTNKTKVLLEQCQNLQGDKEKLVTYINSMENYLKKITDDKELELKIEQDLSLKVKSLEEVIKKLEDSVSLGAGASPEYGHCLKTEECQRQVDQAKNQKEQIDRDIFQQEIKVSKAREGLEIIAKQFNSLAVEESMGGQDALVLSVPVFRGGQLNDEDDFSRHRSELGELLKNGRAATRNAEREVQAELGKTGILEETCRQMKSEEAQKKKDLKSRQQEIEVFQEIIKKEDGDLDAEIARLKEALISIQSQNGMDISSKKKYLRNLEDKLTQTKLLQQQKYEEGLDFLQKSCVEAKEYIERCERIRDEAAKSVLEQTNAAVAAMRNSMTVMDEKVQAVVANIEKNL